MNTLRVTFAVLAISWAGIIWAHGTGANHPPHPPEPPIPPGVVVPDTPEIDPTHLSFPPQSCGTVLGCEFTYTVAGLGTFHMECSEDDCWVAEFVPLGGTMDEYDGPI